VTPRWQLSGRDESAAPYWQLSDLHDAPRWKLASLHARQRPLIKPRPTIYRTTAPSPDLLERSAVEEAPVLNMAFALFDCWQLIDNPREGRFLERISRGAFRKTIRENLQNIRAVLSHGSDPSLGNTVLGEIASIEEAPDAAVARVSLFRSVPALLLDGLRAGVYGASFRGDALKNHVEYRPGRSAHNPERLPEVTRQEIRLKDIGPTPFAQYEGTVAKVGGPMVGALPSRSHEPLEQAHYWELGRDYEPYWQIRRKDGRRGRTYAKN
jgi:hypothetical protein